MCFEDFWTNWGLLDKWGTFGQFGGFLDKSGTFGKCGDSRKHRDCPKVPQIVQKAPNLSKSPQIVQNPVVIIIPFNKYISKQNLRFVAMEQSKDCLKLLIDLRRKEPKEKKKWRHRRG